MTYSQDLDFHAPTQSFWSEGGSYLDFYKDGTIGGDVGIRYEAEASTGTVTADFNGEFAVDYDDYLWRPGTTMLDLSFTGDSNGGLLDTFLGASLDVDWFVDIETWAGDVHESGDLYTADYALDIEKQFTPKLDTPVSGSDDFTMANISKSVSVVEVGMDFDIEQTANFTADAIQGLMVSQHRDTGYTILSPFSIDAMLANLSVPLDLPKSGYWDISFMDMDLLNDFSTGFDLNLVPYIEVDLVVWEDRWDWSVGIDLYDTPTFALAFNQIDLEPGISIFVDIPEPSTMILFALGLLGLLGFSRKYRR
jgi:hypothetical protein